MILKIILFALSIIGNIKELYLNNNIFKSQIAKFNSFVKNQNYFSKSIS